MPGIFLYMFKSKSNFFDLNKKLAAVKRVKAPVPAIKRALFFLLCFYVNYDNLIMYLYGLLVKWLNTLPSQGNIHGFEFHTGHHTLI